MSDTREMTQAAQNQTMDFMRQSQDAFVEAMQVWSDSVSRMMGTAQDRAPSATDLPKPDEVLDQVFDFAESMLAAQREFAHNVMRTASGALAQGEEIMAQETQKATATTKKAAKQS